MQKVAAVGSLVVALACSPAQKADSPAPTPRPRLSSDGAARVALAGGSFEVPASCTVDCVMDVPDQGGILCWEPSGAGQDHCGRFAVDAAVDVHSKAVQDSGSAAVSVYWGVSADGGEFCAVVRSQTGPTRQRTWQFCTRSLDHGVHDVLRRIAESYRMAGVEERSPCGL
jgi:hypothetical protein